MGGEGVGTTVRAAARRGGRGGEGGGGRARRHSGAAAGRGGGAAARRVGGARAAARPGGEGVAPVRVHVWCGWRQSKRLSVGRACLPCAEIQGTRQIGPLPCATIHGTRQITYMLCVPGTAHGKIGFLKSLQIQIQNWLYKILSNEH